MYLNRHVGYLHYFPFNFWYISTHTKNYVYTFNKLLLFCDTCNIQNFGRFPSFKKITLNQNHWAPLEKTKLEINN